MRTIIVFLLFVSLLAWEQLYPARTQAPVSNYRWGTNLAVGGLNFLLSKLFLIHAIIIAAGLAANYKIGLLYFVDIPSPLELAFAIMLLDMGIYVQHRLFHAMPILWRIHQTHHADCAVDLTTGVRFHPLEIVLSTAFKCGLIFLTGATLPAVLLFETLVLVFSIFAHGNIRFSATILKMLQSIFITPNLHLIHHSVAEREYNSNFGTVFSVWDRLFRTLTHPGKVDFSKLDIGVTDLRDEKFSTNFLKVLSIPFLAKNSI